MLSRTKIFLTTSKRLVFLRKRWKECLTFGLDDNKEDSFQTLGVNLTFLNGRFVDQVDHSIMLTEYISFDIEVISMQVYSRRIK